VIDSRSSGPGALFFGLVGSRTDGGRFAADVLAGGAWGAVVGEDWHGIDVGAGALIVTSDPLLALQQLAASWREELGCHVIAITGSTGKTSTKDLAKAMVGTQRSVTATSQNLNTEIGLPLTVLGAPEGTEVLVLELAMRGPGQIAELTQICRPDVGVIVNIGPVHLELLGSIEAIAAAKAELITGLAPGTTAVLPVHEPLLEPYMRSDINTVTFGVGGMVDRLPDGLSIPLPSAHMQLNALAALAASRAVGVEPTGEIAVELSAMRGQRIGLAGGVVVINDCYNANPMSMRAALDDLAASADGRRLAVLGDMLELGEDEERFHAQLAGDAERAGVDLLVAVGPRAATAGRQFDGPALFADDARQAADVVADVVRPGDTVLIKASRGVGLEVVADRLLDELPKEQPDG
jgi:UDP-N-acetylmuramoyl-tripeptide--D-alanyl-D-alanine ligase